MMKQQLPKNWIVLNSKTHPDRVYYFNVKTNQSSWEEPTGQQSEQIGKKSEGSNKRRRSVQPTTPERNVPEPEIKERKKLVAKRSLTQSMEKCNEKKETPQMQIIREKMLAKKEKEMMSKKQSPKGSKDSTKLPIPINKKGPPLSSQSESNGSATTNYTPEMQAILQKIKRKKRKKKSKTQKTEVELNKDNDTTPQNDTVKQRLRNKVAEKNDSRRKTCDPSLIVTTATKKNRKSLRKNIGKERMDQLRKSLTLENSIDKNSDSVDISQSSPVVDKHVIGSKLPSLYKNIEVRLTRLKDKVTKTKIPINKGSTYEKPKILSVETVTTVNDLVRRSNDDSFYEEMDWEPLEDEKITFEVQAVRTQLCTVNNTDVSCSVPNHSLSYPLVSEQQEKRQLYIVVDTNVFLSNISAIDLAKGTVFKTFDQPFIVIPWTVIRELDYIKNNNGKTKSSSLSTKARKAINYINQLFSSKCPFVIGQTREDASRNKEKFSIDCPDDEILQTCLQIRELEKSVVLMSYDINLCNKAMIYDIATLGRNDPLEKIDYLNAMNYTNSLSTSLHEQSKDRLSLDPVPIINQERHIPNEIFNDVKTTMKDFLTMAISSEMHALYGDSWERHVIIRPPWTVVTVFQCAIKHWIAAVSESFLRKAEVVVKELLQIFRDMSGDKTTTEVICVLNKCSDLTQMVNVDKHPELMLRVSQRIDELKQQCRTYENQLNDQKLRDAIGFEHDIAARERRAQKAFQYFEAAYIFARDMCGMAANTVGMPCSFHYNVPNPPPSADYVKQIQPELAANVNRLLHTLSAVLEQVKDSCADYRTLDGLHQTLVTFLPELLPITLKLPDEDLSSLDVYCCVKLKEEVLKTGLRQLQELSTHFCRLASYRCT
ncbi:swt1 RNA endoribonuclease isoform X1 [Halictus rubicundus]|uniref:swt1 RNA endoribonuclease isoform X1 n=1 Tax=Halictus rubicundus TaxID=77578 RepID=UPI004036F8BE